MIEASPSTQLGTGKTSTQQLAEFVASFPTEDVPGEVIEHAKLCLLDTIGCGLFGSTLPQARILFDVLAATTGRGPAAVLGHDRPLSAPDAALANGTAIHAFELDDLHPRSIVHPGSVVTSAALAAASLRPETTGLEFLIATVIGYEVSARVGNTVGAAHLLAGWHPTGTHGTLGAAAAAGRILGLTPDQQSDALGIAGSQSAGLMAAQYESMVKRFHAGRAAQSGVYSALLGREGYRGIRDLFEAEYGGYLSTFSPRSDASRLLVGIGERWETLAVGFKPYSTNGSCHPSIDCLRDMYHQQGVRREDVAEVEIQVSTATAKHVGWPYVPDTVTTAQMNLPFITAVVLTDGDAFVDQFTDERIMDPTLAEFTSRVHVVADPAIDALGDGARHKTRLTVEMLDGRRFNASRDHAHGSACDPMTTDEVRVKFARLVGHLLAQDATARLEHVIATLDHAPQLDDLTELVTVAA